MRQSEMSGDRRWLNDNHKASGMSGFTEETGSPLYAKPPLGLCYNNKRCWQNTTEAGERLKRELRGQTAVSQREERDTLK